MNILAGWLPHAAASVAALSVAFNLYGARPQACGRLVAWFGGGSCALDASLNLPSSPPSPTSLHTGICFMGFSAFGMAASTRVGNALGAGSAEGARTAALASALVAPLIWVAVAAILLFPPSQALLLGLFTTGTDPVLLARMRSLLWLVVVLELFDGAQARRGWRRAGMAGWGG